MHAIEAVVRNGQIVPLGDLELEEGSRVLVTLADGDRDFWSAATEETLKAIWDNEEDYVYADFEPNKRIDPADDLFVRYSEEINRAYARARRSYCTSGPGIPFQSSVTARW